MENRRTVIAFVRRREALVWDADDAVWLRSEWRVVGSLVGSLPLLPRQNAHLGLPLVLGPEEVTLLQEHGVLDLREYSPPVFSPSDEQTFSELREEDFKQQSLLYQERRERLRKEHMSSVTAMESSESQVAEGDKREEEREMAAKRPRLEEGGQDEEKMSSACSTQSLISFSPLVCLHTADPRATLCPSCFKPVHWTFPQSDQERLRYSVFRGLWQQGYYLTSGLKYGGDYLVYKGDPAVVHSQYIAIVLPWQQSITSSNLVSWGRLGSKVKKNTLLCSIDSTGHLKHFTLQWSGIT